MRVGMPLAHAGGFTETVEQLGDYERAGLDIVHLPEAYSFDSVSQLGYLAANTSTVEIGADVHDLYSRKPSLLAMAAAELDYVSGGRVTLGLRASGPEGVESSYEAFHATPLVRIRKIVLSCRLWHQEQASYQGKRFTLPPDAEHGGTGPGKPLNQPIRDRIPIVLAALGPTNVALAAEMVEGWKSVFFHPERARETFGESLAAGAARRDPALGPLQVVVDTQVRITEDPDEQAAALAQVRGHLAVYIGELGARDRVYHDVAVRYGYAEAVDTVQDLHLSGREDEAAAALPEDLVRGVTLVGAPGAVAERVAAFRAAGATTLNVQPLAATHPERVRDIELLKDLSR